MFLNVEEKVVDDAGRILLPKEWRKQNLKEQKVIVIVEENSLKILPKGNKKLAEFFGKAKPTDKIDPFKDYKTALMKASL